MKPFTHFYDLLFGQFGSGDSVLCIHGDRNKFPERWCWFELEFGELAELPEA